MGRQPWIVFGLQRTEDAVSPNVTAFEIGLSLVLFTLIYGLFMVADVYLLAKYGRKGPDMGDEGPGPVEADAASPSLAAAK